MHDEFDINDDVKLHLRESSLLQRQWFKYVFETVEKLNVRIEENTLQVQKEREEFFRALVELREKLREQISTVSKEYAADLKELESRLLVLIENTHASVTKISDDLDCSLGGCKVSQGAELTKLETDLHNEVATIVNAQKELNKKMLDNIDLLTTGYAVIKTKLTVYVALVSVCTTAFIGILATSLLVVYKDFLKAWLGVILR